MYVIFQLRIFDYFKIKEKKDINFNVVYFILWYFKIYIYIYLIFQLIPGLTINMVIPKKKWFFKKFIGGANGQTPNNALNSNVNSNGAHVS